MHNQFCSIQKIGRILPTLFLSWQFASMVGLELKTTAVRSSEINGMAESFVKTMKRDYISIMPKPDGLTAVKNLAEAFEHYNE